MPHAIQHIFYVLADDFFLIHLKKCFGIFPVFVKSFRIRPNNFLWVFPLPVGLSLQSKNRTLFDIPCIPPLLFKNSVQRLSSHYSSVFLHLQQLLLGNSS